VVFGMGNILSNLPTDSTWPISAEDGVAITLEFVVTADGEVTVERPTAHPTWVDRNGGWIVKVVETELARDDLTDGERRRLERSLERTTDVIGDFLSGS
jgi:hypothetical protein